MSLWWKYLRDGDEDGGCVLGGFTSFPSLRTPFKKRDADAYLHGNLYLDSGRGGGNGGVDGKQTPRTLHHPSTKHKLHCWSNRRFKKTASSDMPSTTKGNATQNENKFMGSLTSQGHSLVVCLPIHYIALEKQTVL